MFFFRLSCTSLSYSTVFVRFGSVCFDSHVCRWFLGWCKCRIVCVAYCSAMFVHMWLFIWFYLHTKHERNAAQCMYFALIVSLSLSLLSISVSSLSRFWFDADVSDAANGQDVRLNHTALKLWTYSMNFMHVNYFDQYVVWVSGLAYCHKWIETASSVFITFHSTYFS